MSSKKVKKANLDWKSLPFNYLKTDYNVRSYYKNGKWSKPAFTKDESIKLHMADPCLHYGQEAFEGLKVFETVDGRTVAFRPEANSKRLQSSSEHILIPLFPTDMFMESLHMLVKANAKYVPPFGTGASMYIRPLIIGMGAQVGLGPAKEYLFVMFACPVGPYYKGGFKPVKAIVVEEYDRAAPLGVGAFKVGANYAAGLMGNEFAHKKGFPVALYLDPKKKKYIDEFSTSNFMGISGNKYLTPKSNSILPSITNDSLTIIAQDIGMTVERRPIKISEIKKFNEIGAVGTAAVITPVSLIHYRGKNFIYGDGEKAGPVTTNLYNRLTRIQNGEDPDKFGWLEQFKI